MYAGLVVPDVPLEESEFLRTEAKKNGIELVCQANFLLIYGFQMDIYFIILLILDYDDLVHLLL